MRRINATGESYPKSETGPTSVDVTYAKHNLTQNSGDLVLKYVLCLSNVIVVTSAV